MVINSFSFCLTGKLFVFLSILKDSFAGSCVLGHNPHYLLACKFSAEKSAHGPRGVPLYINKLHFSYFCLQLLTI